MRRRRARRTPLIQAARYMFVSQSICLVVVLSKVIFGINSGHHPHLNKGDPRIIDVICCFRQSEVWHYWLRDL